MKTKLFLFVVLAAVCLSFAGCRKEPRTIHVTGVEVIPATLGMGIGETWTLATQVQPEEADNPSVTWSSDSPSIAEVDSQTGKVTAKAEGTAKITATTTDGGKTDDCIVTVNPDYALINGVKWAKSNVAAPGTFAVKPEDYGMFYQWGKKVGWSSTDPLVSSGGDEDWDTTEYDGDEWLAANDPCPEGWRVPTHDEFIALCDEDAVTNEWTERDGVTGRLFTDKATEKSIFIPAAGYRTTAGSVYVQGTYGGYWSSTAFSSTGGYNLYFGSTYVHPSYGNYCADGCAVRCVCP